MPSWLDGETVFNAPHCAHVAETHQIPIGPERRSRPRCTRYAKCQSQDVRQREARTLEQNTRCVAELAEGRDSAENGGADDAGCSKCLSEPGMIQCHEEIERRNLSQVTGCVKTGI